MTNDTRYIPPHVRLMLDNSEIGMTCTRITQALDDLEQRHTLPGLLMDLYGSVDALIERARHADPAISLAWAAGLRSTRDLPPPDILSFTLEKAA